MKFSKLSKEVILHYAYIIVCVCFAEICVTDFMKSYTSHLTTYSRKRTHTDQSNDYTGIQWQTGEVFFWLFFFFLIRVTDRNRGEGYL